jgi:ribosomal protein L13E
MFNRETPKLQKKVNRLEVIDHRAGVGTGRVFSVRPCAVTLSYQDQGRTLKVFVDDPPNEVQDG